MHPYHSPLVTINVDPGKEMNCLARKPQEDRMALGEMLDEPRRGPEDELRLDL